MRNCLPIVFGLLWLCFASGGQAQETQRFGSTLRAAPNLVIGCGRAPILDPISGQPILARTGQTTCTMRNVGYLNNIFRVGSFVPSNGVVTRVRVRSGANPAPLRVVIMQCSPGLCGTVIRSSGIFRPLPNRITAVDVNLPVARSLSSDGTQVIDAVGLSAVGPGTLPLADEGTAGTFTSGSALTQFWYPRMTRNEPRVEGHTIDGVELLMQWLFRAGGPGS